MKEALERPVIQLVERKIVLEGDQKSLERKIQHFATGIAFVKNVLSEMEESHMRAMEFRGSELKHPLILESREKDPIVREAIKDLEVVLAYSTNWLKMKLGFDYILKLDLKHEIRKGADVLVEKNSNEVIFLDGGEAAVFGSILEILERGLEFFATLTDSYRPGSFYYLSDRSNKIVRNHIMGRLVSAQMYISTKCR